MEKSRRDDWKVVETLSWIRGVDREFLIAECFQIETVELFQSSLRDFSSVDSTQDCILG
jgi:hypothetical protein